MTAAANEPTLRIWTIDVPALDRAVTVFMNNGCAPSTRDLLWSLDSEEDRHLVQAAHEAWMKELRETSVPLPEPVEHDCDRAWCGCCPGCLDGCGDCEPYVICWDRDLDCVMRAGHTGNCVPGGSPWKSRAVVDELAEPLRVAGVEHAFVQHERNPERWRLDHKVDHRVPASGRWVRRWTPHNTKDTQAWLAEVGCTDFDVQGDEKGPLLLTARDPQRRLLEVPMGDIVRVEKGKVTVHDGGWVNCGRALPAGWSPDSFPFEWPLR